MKVVSKMVRLISRLLNELVISCKKKKRKKIEKMLGKVKSV